MNNPSTLRKQALWLNGVLIGLALKEAVVPIIKHFVESSDGSVLDAAPEFFRLVAFIMLVVRYWIGTNLYFDEVHERPVTLPGAESVPGAWAEKAFLRDFLFNLVQSLFFAFMALSIPIHSSAFLIALWSLLAYDVIWIAWKRGKPDFEMLKSYAVVNLIALALSVVAFFVTGAVFRDFSSPFAVATEEFVALYLLIATLFLADAARQKLWKLMTRPVGIGPVRTSMYTWEIEESEKELNRRLIIGGLLTVAFIVFIFYYLRHRPI